MYKKIILDSTYIDNLSDDLNFGSDQVLELSNEYIEGIEQKHISRLLFKIKEFDENTIAVLEEELYNNSDTVLNFTCKVLNLKQNEKLYTNLMLYPITEAWLNGYGDSTTECTEGATWINNGYNSWVSGGAYTTNSSISFDTKNIVNLANYNNYITLRYTNLLDIIDYEDLFSKGFIFKFLSSSESSPAEYFNLYLDKENTYILAKYRNSTYEQINTASEVLVNLTNPFYLWDDIKEYYIKNDTNMHNYITINLFVNQFTSSVSYFETTRLNYILPSSSTYSIYDITSNETIIKDDLFYNTINHVSGEMFFDIDLSILTQNHDYKIIYYVKDINSNLIKQVNTNKYFRVI